MRFQFFIRQRNILALTVEIYKTLNDLDPTFMKEVFCLKEHNYPTRKQNLFYPNPRTVSYGIKTFGYKTSQIWGNILKDIQEVEDISTFKRNIINYCESICYCNLCKSYVAKVGYLDKTVPGPYSLSIPSWYINFKIVFYLLYIILLVGYN